MKPIDQKTYIQSTATKGSYMTHKKELLMDTLEIQLTCPPGLLNPKKQVTDALNP